MDKKVDRDIEKINPPYFQEIRKNLIKDYTCPVCKSTTKPTEGSTSFIGFQEQVYMDCAWICENCDEKIRIGICSPIKDIPKNG